MKISRDRVSAFLLLVLSFAYFMAAREIELYPGSEDELINARTFPRFIGASAMAFSLLIVVLPSGGGDTRVDWRQFDWIRTALLCGLMVLYGLTIKTLGFFLSTSLFLAAGFLVLGERRIWALFLGAVPIAAGFEWLLDGMLGIYIEDPLLVWLGIK